jgi:hypothetical protein
MAIVSVWKQNLVAWALTQFSAQQWHTLNMLLDVDGLMTLQDSLTDCRHQRFVSMSQAFDDLD